ncbi:MAG TPA: APC family permease [Ktedonobacterales bacterium]
MSQQTISAEAGGAAAPHGAADHGGMHKLGALLCWAVVFADIGTSVYYVPGILYGQFGHLAGLFVTLTLGAFVLLALKYAEVSVRFPEGGGVVTVSARALNPWMGALGGMFILVDYFLTAAISSLSGLQYFQDVYPPIKPFVLIATITVLILLGVLNWWGIRESAMVSLYIAVAAFISDIVVIAAVLYTIPIGQILQLVTSIFQGSHLTPVAILTGFAGAFLAFSGLESISQLSPVMKRPRSRTVTIALSLVVITVGFTSPLLTIFSTTLLDGKHNALLAHTVAHIDPNQFISQLGTATAGQVIGIATAVIASALLIFASNTAIIGTYHVFLALSRMSFFPRIVETRDKHRDTPIVSIALATAIPIAILLFANGQIDLLGQLYAFGLLGAFSLTCISVDALRYRERRGGKQITLHDEDAEIEAQEDARAGFLAQQSATPAVYDDDEDDELAPAAPAAPAEPTARERALALWREYWRRYWPTVNFGLGILTTVLVFTAWVTNLISKRDATIFGSSLTVVGMTIAILHYNQQRRRGANTVQPSWAMSFWPDSVFAIAHSGAADNAQVIESAFRAARGRKVLVLFLSSRVPPNLRIMQINDPALRDDEAQDVFRLAQRLRAQTGSPAEMYYRIGAVSSAAALWRVARSQEVVADREIAHEFAAFVAPTYVRYKRQGEANLVHLIIRPREDGAAGATPAPIPVVSANQSAQGKPAAPVAPEAALYDDTGGLADETWMEDLRTMDERYDTGAGRAVRNGRGAVERPAQEYPEPPRPDHEHDGDTKPRHQVKVMHSVLPSQSGILEAPRPAPQPKPSTRMTEPTPIESDDEEWYYWNGEDLVRRDEPPANGQNGGPPDQSKS